MNPDQKSLVIYVHGIGGKRKGEMLEYQKLSNTSEDPAFTDGKNIGKVCQDNQGNLHLEYLWNELSVAKSGKVYDFWQRFKYLFIATLGLFSELPRMGEVVLHQSQERGTLLVQRLISTYRHFVLGLTIPMLSLLLLILITHIVLRVFFFVEEQTAFHAVSFSLLISFSLYYLFGIGFKKLQHHFKIEASELEKKSFLKHNPWDKIYWWKFESFRLINVFYFLGVPLLFLASFGVSLFLVPYHSKVLTLTNKSHCASPLELFSKEASFEKEIGPVYKIRDWRAENSGLWTFSLGKKQFQVKEEGHSLHLYRVPSWQNYWAETLLKAGLLSGIVPFFCTFLVFLICFLKIGIRSEKTNQIWKTVLITLFFSSFLTNAFFAILFSIVVNLFYYGIVIQHSFTATDVLTHFVKNLINEKSFDQYYTGGEATWWFVPSMFIFFILICVFILFLLYYKYSEFTYKNEKPKNYGKWILSGIQVAGFLGVCGYFVFNLVAILDFIGSQGSPSFIQWVERVESYGIITGIAYFSGLALFLFILTDLFIKKSVLAHGIELVRDFYLYISNRASREGDSLFCRKAISLLKEIIMKSPCRNILILAHSQGTVVCYDLFREYAEELCDKNIQWITFGSPLTHLYSHFMSHSMYPAYLPYPICVKEWRNYYHDGDYIGQSIECESEKIIQINLKKGGHEYWGNEIILNHVQKVLHHYGSRKE